jgi:hypothetical protein
MQNLDGRLTYSPTDPIKFLESPFSSWMDRCYLTLHACDLTLGSKKIRNPKLGHLQRANRYNIFSTHTPNAVDSIGNHTLCIYLVQWSIRSSFSVHVSRAAEP